LSTDFRKILKYQITWEPMFHADRLTDGQTETMKPIVAFSNFANAPKKLQGKE